jgi:hypothetical protein
MLPAKHRFEEAQSMNPIQTKKDRREETEALGGGPPASSEKHLQLRTMDFADQQAALSPDRMSYDVQASSNAPVQLKDAVQKSGDGNQYTAIKSDMEAARQQAMYSNVGGTKTNLNAAIDKLQAMKDGGHKFTSSQHREIGNLQGQVNGYANNTDVTALCGRVIGLLLHLV